MLTHLVGNASYKRALTGLTLGNSKSQMVPLAFLASTPPDFMPPNTRKSPCNWATQSGSSGL